MRPIDKTSEDLFQKLRSRFSPISMGDENAEETADPAEARIFNFMYKEGDNEVGYVSISIVDNRSFKVYFGTDIIENMEVKTDWYAFLRDLRMFAKRNLMSFDARDLAKNQLEPRDFKFISQQDGTYKDHEVAVSESVMFGSRRKSYQTTESAKLIVNHRKSVDETVPGARSRYIESIYIENADGERYKFPYNYLTGARTMLSHVSEGGNPYDDVGKHIVGMVKEMKDLSKFARRTKKYAMEDEQAGSIREKVVERFQSLKKQLGALTVKENYKNFVESFKPQDEGEDDLEQLKERFTRQVFDPQLEDTLPAVNRALKEAEVNALAQKTTMPKEAIAYEAWAAEIVPEGKFGGEKAAYKMGLKHGTTGEKKIDAEKSFGVFAKYYYQGYDHAKEHMDWRLEKPRTVKNLPKEFDKKKTTESGFYRDGERTGSAEGAKQAILWRIKNQHLDLIKQYGLDKVLQAVDDEAMYLDNLEEIGSSDISAWVNNIKRNLAAEVAANTSEDYDPTEAHKARRAKEFFNDPSKITQSNARKIYKKHNDQAVTGMDEAGTIGTMGTTGTSAAPQKPVNPGELLKDPNLQQAAKNVSKVAQAAGIKSPAPQVAQAMAAQAAGKKPSQQAMQTVGGLGNTIMQAAANDPKKAAQLQAMMKKMVVQGKFDEDAVKAILSGENVSESAPGLDLEGVVSSILDYKLHHKIKSKEHILQLIKHFGSHYTSYKTNRKQFVSDVLAELKARMNRYDWPE